MSLELTGGDWYTDHRGVRRWLPDPVPELPQQVGVSTLVACPFCRAKVNQTCVSSGGNPREPHVTRLAPRLCACGALLEVKKHMCEPCRIEARAETYRLRERRHPTAMRRAS